MSETNLLEKFYESCTPEQREEIKQLLEKNRREGREEGVRSTFKHFRDLEQRRIEREEHQKIHQG